MGLLIVALAIGVRVAWVLLVPTRPVGDFAMYIESARYLVEHRVLDPEFIYMPGYVGMVAAVQALGGGLFAIKMIGVVAGGLAAAAVYGHRRGCCLARRPRSWPACCARCGPAGSRSPA